MLKLLGPFTPYIVGGVILALVAGGSFLYLKGGSDRETTIRAQENQQRLDDIGKARGIEDKTNKLPSTTIDRDLNEWMRD